MGDNSGKSINRLSGLRLLPAIILAGVCCLAISLSGCRQKEKPNQINLRNVDAMPTMLTRNVSTLISDSGYTRYHITTPLWLMFENVEDPTWRFPDGLQLDKYDNFMNVDATITCDSATYFSQRRIWRLDGNVRMRNTEGDKFLTNQIFWDQTRHSVYSDSFIHIERSTRIIEGFGFVSNEQMTDYTVKQTSGIFPVPERKQPGETSAASANDIQGQEQEKPSQPAEKKMLPPPAPPATSGQLPPPPPSKKTKKEK